MKTFKLTWILILVTFVLTFEACQNKSDLELAFDKFVKENVDDPSSYKELVSISKIDSVDFYEWVNNAREMIKLSEESDSILLNFSEIIAKSKINFSNPKYESSVNYLKWHIIFWEENTLKELSARNRLKEAAENIDTENCKLIIYEIKSRFKVHDGLKLQTYYAIENNTGEVKFYTEKPCVENYDGKNIDIINQCKEYEFYSTRKKNFMDAWLELMSKIKTNEI